MNELETMLREQLKAAAAPVAVPVDEQAVLAAGRRARRARVARWAVAGLALVAALVALVWAVWQWMVPPVIDGVPQPTPTIGIDPHEPGGTPTPTGDPSQTPAGQPSGKVGDPAHIVLHEDNRLVATAIPGGIRFTGGETGAQTLDVAAPASGVKIHAGFPDNHWAVAVLPKGTTWALVTEHDGKGKQVGIDTQVVSVPGTDAVAAAVLSIKNPVVPANVRLVYGDANGNVHTSDGRTLVSRTFQAEGPRTVTVFVDDTWEIVGATDQFGTADFERVRAGAVPAIRLPIVGTTLNEVCVVLPAKISYGAISLDYEVASVVDEFRLLDLPDGRTLVYGANRADGIREARGPWITYEAPDQTIRTEMLDFDPAVE